MSAPCPAGPRPTRPRMTPGEARLGLLALVLATGGVCLGGPLGPLLSALGGLLGLALVVLSRNHLRAGAGFAAAATLVAAGAVTAAVLGEEAHREHGRASACRSNLIHTAAAANAYRLDHDGSLPPAERWATALEPELRSPQTLACPSARDRPCGYAWNEGLAARPRLVEPERVPMLFDALVPWDGAGGPGSIDPRHESGDGPGANVAFADGHMRIGRPEAFGRYLWHPAEGGDAP
jgi:prepilin-type processing-associated H-X9-DG protein